MRYWSTLLSSLICLLLLAGPAAAGWVVEEADGHRQFIEDGKVKDIPEEADEVWMVLDFKSGQALVVNPANKTYARADLNQYCAILSQMAAHFRQMMGVEEEKPLPVSIQDKGQGPEIAGFATRHYLVYMGEELVEELWVSADVPFLAEFNEDLLAKTMGCGATPNDAESDPAYQRLLASAWVMKSLYYEDGQPDTDTDVTSIQQQDLPAGEFAPPEGFRQVSMQEAMSEQ